MQAAFQLTGQGSFTSYWNAVADVLSRRDNYDYFHHERLGRLAVARRGSLVVSVPAAATSDFIFGNAFEVFVNRRAKDALDGAIGGAVFEHVRLVDTPHVDELWHLRVDGFAGFVSTIHGVKITDRYDPIGWYAYSITSTYDILLDRRGVNADTDIFIMWPFPLVTFVTERFRDVCRQHALTGAAFINIQDLEPLYGPVTPGVPSVRLSKMNTARLLSDPLYSELILNH